ncbi:MAG: restriction endonuclease subunit S [Marinobacter sp.]|nr:restriction endonuclease subunit S [Marinobacter sp.]
MSVAWQEVRIGDVFKTGAGGTPLKSRKEFYENGEVPWLLSGEISKRDIKHAKNCITPIGLDNSSAKIFPKDSVLVAMYGATAGQVGILRINAATNQAVCAIYPSDEVLPEYLYYALLSKNQELVSKASGNAQPNISQSKIRNTKILLPSIFEQKRIVAILDEAFAGIDAAIANTEKNLANARELFESYLNSLFLRNVESWPEKRLDGLCEKITVGHVGSMAQRYQGEGIPLLRSQNIRPFEIDLNKVVYIDSVFHAELKKSALKPGDLAIVRTGYPGTAAVIPECLSPVNCSDLVIVRPSSEVSSHYLAVVFNSPYGKSAVTGALVGAAQKHFNVTAAKAAQIPLPSRKEQDNVVSEAAAIRAECLDLGKKYSQKLSALSELKQSLLQKAFSGELTANFAEKETDEAVA